MDLVGKPTQDRRDASEQRKIRYGSCPWPPLDLFQPDSLKLVLAASNELGEHGPRLTSICECVLLVHRRDPPGRGPIRRTTALSGYDGVDNCRLFNVVQISVLHTPSPKRTRYNLLCQRFKVIADQGIISRSRSADRFGERSVTFV
jgi:hypothetical protein